LLQRYLLKSQDESAGSYPLQKRGPLHDRVRTPEPDGPLPQGICCSVIFCRNIMIYFDKPTQQSLVQRLSEHLEDGGYLFIGHSESLNNIAHGLDYVCPATYRKPGGARRPDRAWLMALVIGIGDCKVSNDPSDVLVTHALGSCIAVLLYDPVARVAGLLHYMLPESSLDPEKSGSCPFCLPTPEFRCCCRMSSAWAPQSRGWSSSLREALQMLDTSRTFNIGHRNHIAMRKFFWKAGVIVHKEEIGGTSSRTVSIDVASGRVQLRMPGAPQREIIVNFRRNGGSDGLQHTHRR
jgi:chemotaxis protein CheD